jgi:hypothetical protein
VDLIQLVRFLVVELIYSGSNPKFEHLQLIILSVRGDVPSTAMRSW